MPASAPAGALDLPAPELAARVALGCGIAIWLAMRAGPLLLEVLIPYLEAAVRWLDSRYRIEFALTYRTGHGGSGSELGLFGRATVTRLFFISTESRLVAMQAGSSMTSSTAVGVILQPVVAITALVLAWPSRTGPAMIVRSLLGLGMALAWLLAGLPASLWLYFQDIPLRALAPGETTLATPAGKFLLNGGSVAVGLALGVLAIAGGNRLAGGRRVTHPVPPGTPPTRG